MCTDEYFKAIRDFSKVRLQLQEEEDAIKKQLADLLMQKNAQEKEVDYRAAKTEAACNDMLAKRELYTKDMKEGKMYSESRFVFFAAQGKHEHYQKYLAIRRSELHDTKKMIKSVMEKLVELEQTVRVHEREVRRLQDAEEIHEFAAFCEGEKYQEEAAEMLAKAPKDEWQPKTGMVAPGYLVYYVGPEPRGDRKKYEEYYVLGKSSYAYRVWIWKDAFKWGLVRKTWLEPVILQA
jgi:hypothetical protein